MKTLLWAVFFGPMMNPGLCPRAPSHEGGSKEEFLAMTFVDGPEEASFLDERPAKLRFFLGYVDEFAPGDGSNQVRGIGVHCFCEVVLMMDRSVCAIGIDLGNVSRSPSGSCRPLECFRFPLVGGRLPLKVSPKANRHNT